MYMGYEIEKKFSNLVKMFPSMYLILYFDRIMDFRDPKIKQG